MNTVFAFVRFNPTPPDFKDYKHTTIDIARSNVRECHAGEFEEQAAYHDEYPRRPRGLHKLIDGLGSRDLGHTSIKP